ncbi:hypothetical protein BDB00DRAFT_789575 [Zychaea mexicana]|uniref:uncharacterized protein n=1 Tax=Zychaea mexicana TaxID=64656 RepID=UPI0022FF1761|nr:uncharacterized protein BDB00DRAFT_789575 [Zychaea mexicana]KAI9491443.1 hypothetical protein BDB00DRAFT_789575 [Zychaea mexicana]
MATEEQTQAIAMLQDLGISRKQAVKALARYGNDVSRAADFIFSGNAIDSDSDSDSNHNSTSNNNNNEESEAKSPPSLTPPSPPLPPPKNTTTNPDTQYSWDNNPVPWQSQERQHLIKDFDRKAESSTTVSYDPALWSVVPAALPIGLRPPQFNFPYVPAILQSLFHISLFQQRVFAYPTGVDVWGSALNYWNGNGEPIPSFNGSCETPSSNRSNNSGSDSNAGKNNMDRKLAGSVKAVAELQKLFAFLGHSRRQYVNVSQFVQSLDTKTAHGSNWDAQDLSVDEFIDLFINTLVEADDRQKTQPNDNSFRSLFSLCAQVEYGRDIDKEEIYYLTLGFNEQTLSFHECLGPLVYESATYGNDTASDVVSFSSDEGSIAGGKAYKLTTFERVPPILVICLEDKTLKTKAGTINSLYQVDRTLYMDRYLFENRDKILKRYEQAQAWRDEINDASERMAKLRNNNLTNGQGKTAAADKSDILSKTIDYFEEYSADEATQSLRNVLNQVKDGITARLEELEELVKQRTDDLRNLFNDSEYCQAPYDIRAILHHDGMSGTGHYWGYIWAEPGEENLLQDIPNDRGGWFKFCDASVRPSNEDEIFNETSNPFALVYVKRDIPRYTGAQLFNIIPSGLQAYVDRDNEDFDEEIQSFNNGERNPEEESPGLTVSQDGDSISTDGDAASNGTAVGENATAATTPITAATTTTGNHKEAVPQPIVSATAPPSEAADNATLEHSLSESQLSQLSQTSSSEEQQKPPDQEEAITAKNNTILRGKLHQYIQKVLICAEQYGGDDYRLLKSFEAFLGKLGYGDALEYFIFTYTTDQEYEAPIIREEDSRDDPKLVALWLEFDKFVSIASIISTALAEFGESRYLESLRHFTQTRQEEASWKVHLLTETDMLEQFPDIENLGFAPVITRFGKQCIRVLNERARTKAADPAYRTRGLEEALQIARQAQTIIGPDKFANDVLFSEMREEWLKYSEVQGAELEGSQAELLNELIMAYLEADSADAANESSSITTSLKLCKKLNLQ